MTAPSHTSPAPSPSSHDAARGLLLGFLDEAIAAAHPSRCLVPHLPAPGTGRLIILGAGKAGGSMAAVASRFYRSSTASTRAASSVWRWPATATAKKPR